MAEDDEELDHLAEAISDHTPVDWPQRLGARPDLEPLIRCLRDIEVIGNAHRGLTDIGNEAEATGSGMAGPPAAGIPARIGPYEIDGILGRGGMGIVYLGTDTRLGRRVAVKALPDALANDPEGLRRFEREARLLASLSHPHIAIVYGLEMEGGRPHLVMEQVEGVTLATRLKEGALEPGEALGFCLQIATALEAAHEQHLIHRDLKPGNVMIGRRGAAKVLDFGLATRVREAPRSTLSTLSLSSSEGDIAVRVGTPGYMSPEQVLGLAQDARTDVFSFGCVLYECLAGRRAFGGSDPSDLLAAALAAEPDWSALPSRTPRAVHVLLKRCMQKEPSRRPGMAEVRRELEAIVRGLEARRLDAVSNRSGAGAGQADHNLPHETTSFVGREREIGACLDLVQASQLVTLTGIGGCGKTRLALRVASELVTDFPGGAWFVDLSPIADPGRVVAALADVLGVREETSSLLLETLLGALVERRALVILDNCEQVLSACAELASTLLQQTPVRLLATSREPLGVPGERIYNVPPLAVPDRDGAQSPSVLAGYDAVQLFVERARLLDPGLAFDEDNAAAIADLCVRLDGIPLGLELAAARVKVLSVREIGDRLNERFRLLTTPSGVLARHQKLHSVIAWSYEHLAAEEQRLMRTLSSFSGGASLDAVVSIFAADEFEVLELLSRLAEKSLVTVERNVAGRSRYRMLETVRHFGLAELDGADETSAVRNRHLDYFLRVVEEAAPRLMTSQEGEWFSWCVAEQQNLLDVLSWCDHAEDGAAKGLRMVGWVWRFWLVRGELRLAGAKLAEALARKGAESRSPDRAKVLYLAGNTAVYSGDHATARGYYEEGLTLSRALGDDPSVGASLLGLGMVLINQGDFAGARSRWEESLAVFRELGHKRGVSASLANLGEMTRMQGDFESARAYTEEAIPLMREAGDMEALVLDLANLVTILLSLGRIPEAYPRAAEALRLTREVGARRTGADALESTSLLAVETGQPERAARWLAAAVAHREAIGAPPSEHGKGELEACFERLRGMLGGETLARLRTEGAALTFEAAIDEAILWIAEAGAGDVAGR